MSEDTPAQCPECNRWSDRNEYVQLADPEPYGSDAPRYACLAHDCAGLTFTKGTDKAALLNMDAIRDSRRRTVAGVKQEKLEHYDNLGFSVV